MKYIITENQFDRILSDENISYINKTTTRLFNPIYPEIQDIVITKMNDSAWGPPSSQDIQCLCVC
jgi:hypothetical protein